MEKLKLKHIAPYVSYPLHLKAIKDVSGEKEIVCITGYVKEFSENLFFENFDTKNGGNYNIEYFKPILVSLNNFTCDSSELEEYRKEFICSVYVINQINMLAEGVLELKDCTFDTVKLMQSEKIDYLNLIKYGLAVDVKTLDVNPYKP